MLGPSVDLLIAQIRPRRAVSLIHCFLFHPLHLPPIHLVSSPHVSSRRTDCNHPGRDEQASEQRSATLALAHCGTGRHGIDINNSQRDANARAVTRPSGFSKSHGKDALVCFFAPSAF